MLKKLFDILHKTMTSRLFWAGVLLCLAFSTVNVSPAEAGYDCPKTQVLKERYQGDCFPCQIVNVLLSSFMRAAGKVYDVSKDAGNKLLFLGTFMWLAFWALRKMSSLTNVEPAAMSNELVVFLGKVVVAYCFINAGIGTLVSYAINPILGAGAEFGTALLVESKNFNMAEKPKSENSYTGPTEIVSKDVMDKILKLSEGVSNEVAMNLVIGNAVTCFSIEEGINFHIKFIIDIHIPDIWMWLVGAAIWCAGFMLVLSVCYYLIDIPFKIGFAIIALPVVIGLWPFKLTSGKLKSVVMIALNAAGTFLFLALSSSYAMKLISSSFSTVGGLETESGTVLNGTDALLYALEQDNVKYINNVFTFTGAAFLIILFCYIYGIKMISQITNKWPDKFFGGSMTAGAGSPLHHMATAATMWATNKAAAPLKMARDIVANQAGKAATTVAKAGFNVGAGAVSNVAGRAVKFAGKKVNKLGQHLAGKAQDNKEAWEALSDHDNLNQAGLGAKIGNKFGRMKAGMRLGLANTIAKAGESMENGGELMKAPGSRAWSRMTNAAREGMDELNESLGELAGQMPTGLGKAMNKFAQTQNGLADQDRQNLNKPMEKARRAVGKAFGNIGNKIVENQPQGVQAAAQRDYIRAKEKFGESSRKVEEKFDKFSRKLATYVPKSVGEKVRGLGFYYTANAENSDSRVNAFLSQKLGSALTNAGNTVLSNRPGENSIRHIIATLDKAKLKTVFSGKAIAVAGKVQSKFNDFKQEIKVNREADKKAFRESRDQLKYNVTHLKEINAERLQENKAILAASAEGFNENFGIRGIKNSVKDTKNAFNELRGYTDDDGNVIKGSADDLGSALGAGVTTPFTSAGRSFKEAGEYLTDSKVENAFDVVGAMTIQPAFAITHALRETGKETLESTYQVAEKTMLAGIDVALTLTSWTKTPAKAAVYGAYAMGDMAKIVATPIMTGVSTVFDAADTARKAVRTVTRPIAMTLGAVTLAPIGFAAKAVDETLYAGYKMTVRPAVELGTAAVRGANLLYRGTVAAAASTTVGRGVAKTFRAGSKTLKVGVKTLNLGRNIIRAAAGEGGYSNRILTPEEIAKNKEARKQREREAQEKAERKRRAREQRRREEEQRERERQDELQAQEQREQREREAAEAERRRDEERQEREREAAEAARLEEEERLRQNQQNPGS